MRLVCELLGLSRSTFYYHSHDRSDAEAFKAALENQAGLHPSEGYGPSEGHFRHLREPPRSWGTRLRRLKSWRKTSRGRVQRWMQTLQIQRKRRRKPNTP